MPSTITGALGSKWHRNIILGSTILTIGVWLALNTVTIPSFPSSSVTIMAALFGLMALVVSLLIKHENVDRRGTAYGTVTSVTCIIMLFMWLESPTSEITISLSIFTVGLILISHFEILNSVHDGVEV